MPHDTIYTMTPDGLVVTGNPPNHCDTDRAISLNALSVAIEQVLIADGRKHIDRATPRIHVHASANDEALIHLDEWAGIKRQLSALATNQPQENIRPSRVTQ
jgi:hypothetical protein